MFRVKAPILIFEAAKRMVKIQTAAIAAVTRKGQRCAKRLTFFERREFIIGPFFAAISYV